MRGIKRERERGGGWQKERRREKRKGIQRVRERQIEGGHRERLIKVKG